MDTPVRLISSKVQVAFIGNISDQRLRRMMKRKNPLIITAIKWVLGEDFIDNADCYRVNSDICLCFMASLLNVGVGGYEASKLTRALFLGD